MINLTKKERLSRAMHSLPVDYPPVWLMRQAGRYLPEYRKVRENYSFHEMSHIPEIAAEVSIQPLEILDVDAVIVFNDILTPFELIGRNVVFTENGPVVDPPFRLENELDLMEIHDPGDVPPVYNSIQMIRKEIGSQVPILGFAGSPFTLASYLVEGEMSKNLQIVKTLLYGQPDVFHKLLEKLTLLAIEYLKMQIRAGADAVQIFDTWAGSLSQADYRRFALPYQKQIIDTIQADGIPVILYVNGSGLYLDEMKQSGASVLSVDWRVDLKSVIDITGDIPLQGNLDPTLLFADVETVTKHTRLMIENVGRKTGYIANLGHGILPGAPVDSVKAFVAAVKEK